MRGWHVKYNCSVTFTLFCSVKFVVDHIAKPYVKDQKGFDEWRLEMKEISSFPNVWCKM